MTDGPVTWHYGLIARWWAEVNSADPAELAWYDAAIQRYGEPALDLGCGAGRLLVPLSAAGYDVDGVDVSGDMLDRCREVAASAGVNVAGRLHRQAFQELDLARRYGTIYCCDSLGIGGDAIADQEALRRVFAHLRPGGAFVFSADTPSRAGADANAPRELPRPWPDHGERRRLSDGDELELRSRLLDTDDGGRRRTLQIRALLWRGEDVVSEEHRELRLIDYTPGELRHMLGQAGLEDITVEGTYTGVPPTPDTETIVFTARRNS